MTTRSNSPATAIALSSSSGRWIVAATVTASGDDKDRGRAIGLWSGLAGIFTVLGPFVGGVLIQSGPHGWRWIFLINLPFLLLAYAFTRAGVPPLPGRRTEQNIWAQVDLVGATTATLGLGLVVGALIEANRLGPLTTAALVVAGTLTLVGFLAVELSPQPNQNARTDA